MIINTTMRIQLRTFTRLLAYYPCYFDSGVILAVVAILVYAVIVERPTPDPSKMIPGAKVIDRDC